MATEWQHAQTQLDFCLGSFISGAPLTLDFWLYVLDTHTLYTLYTHILALGWSEFAFFWKLQKARAVSGPRHSTDFRTIDEIIIG